MFRRYYFGVLVFSIALNSMFTSDANAIYSPQTGRFLTRDPIGYLGGSLSLYQFANSRSLSYWDPTGLMAMWENPKKDPYVVDPGHTNCAGFALHPNMTAVAPTGSLIDMIAGLGFGNCILGAGASRCLDECKTKNCVQSYVYVKNGVENTPNWNLQTELEKGSSWNLVAGNRRH